MAETQTWEEVKYQMFGLHGNQYFHEWVEHWKNVWVKVVDNIWLVGIVHIQVENTQKFCKFIKIGQAYLLTL